MSWQLVVVLVTLIIAGAVVAVAAIRPSRWSR